jgi:hypothetical protein
VARNTQEISADMAFHYVYKQMVNSSRKVNIQGNKLNLVDTKPILSVEQTKETKYTYMYVLFSIFPGIWCIGGLFSERRLLAVFL